MSKAVLVMDMPKKCNECCLCKTMPDKCNYCMATNKIIVDAGRKRYWCPLKPIPKRKERAIVGGYSHGYVAGWNDCIDTMIGCNANDEG